MNSKRLLIAKTLLGALFLCCLTENLEANAARSCQEALWIHKLERLVWQERILDMGGEVFAADPDAAENLPNLNCHGYSCRKNGLTRIPSWVENRRFKGLLLTYFEKVKAYSQGDVAIISNDADLVPGDVVAFTTPDWRKPPGAAPLYIHSGLIVSHTDTTGDTQNWIRSKLGKMVTADLPIDQLYNIYARPEMTIEIWRRVNRRRPFRDGPFRPLR